MRLRTIFSTRTLFHRQVKDITPTHHLANVIYKFSCRCDSVYAGRISQRLHIRMGQHVPKLFLEHMCGRITSTRKKTSWKISSSIGKHLHENPDCAKNYRPQDFSVLARGRSEFHLRVLEAMYIKALSPDLCKQKRFVHDVILYKGPF